MFPSGVDVEYNVHPSETSLRAHAEESCGLSGVAESRCEAPEIGDLHLCPRPFRGMLMQVRSGHVTDVRFRDSCRR